MPQPEPARASSPFAVASAHDPSIPFERGQESVLLNIQPACQAAIDLAIQELHVSGLEPPTDARDAFRRLEHAGVITPELSQRLQSMVGFRNIAVHRYHDLDLNVVRSIIDHRLEDLLQLATRIEQQAP